MGLVRDVSHPRRDQLVLRDDGDGVPRLTPMFYVSGEYGSAQVVHLGVEDYRVKIKSARPATREELFMYKELKAALCRIEDLERESNG